MKFDAHAHCVDCYGNHDEPVEVGAVHSVPAPPLQPLPRFLHPARFFLQGLVYFEKVILAFCVWFFP